MAKPYRILHPEDPELNRPRTQQRPQTAQRPLSRTSELALSRATTRISALPGSEADRRSTTSSQQRMTTRSFARATTRREMELTSTQRWLAKMPSGRWQRNVSMGAVVLIACAVGFPYPAPSRSSEPRPSRPPLTRVEVFDRWQIVAAELADSVNPAILLGNCAASREVDDAVKEQGLTRIEFDRAAAAVRAASTRRNPDAGVAEVFMMAADKCALPSGTDIAGAYRRPRVTDVLDPALSDEALETASMLLRKLPRSEHATGSHK